MGRNNEIQGWNQWDRNKQQHKQTKRLNEKLVPQRNQQVLETIAKLTKKLNDSIQVNEIRSERDDFTADPEEIWES